MRLGGCNAQFGSNFLHFRDRQSILNFILTSKRGVCLQKDPVMFCPLTGISQNCRYLLFENTHRHQFWLWVPVAQFHLIDSRFNFEGVSCQILDAANVEADIIDSLSQYFMVWTIYVLADADIPDFAFGNHLLKFLPSRVWVLGQVEINLIGLAAFLERNRPYKSNQGAFSESLLYEQTYTYQCIR